MTELWIDGVAAVLPANMSVTVKRENPFFTKNGEYTYELALPLTNAINANLYKHLNRMNSVTEVKSKRSAMLVANNRMYCNGTEVVVGWTDKTVSIQIASGNSELNYFIGSDLKISFLKMPVTSPLINRVPDKRWIEKLYPEIDFCLSPIVDRAKGKVINEWIINTISASRELRFESKATLEEFDFVPQPFLCAYIRELLKSVGYELTYNALEETVWKDLCICHVNTTHDWAQMLPGYRVKDFLEEIEKLYNMSFLIDFNKRQAKLLFNNSYFGGSAVAYVRDVVDEYEVACEEEEDAEHGASNIEYKFPDNSYFRHRCLPKAVSEKAKRGVIPSSTDPNYWFNHLADALHHDKNVIFTWETNKREYVFVKNFPNPKTEFAYQMINEFKHIKREGTTNTIELNMMPVEMCDCFLHLYVDGAITEAKYRYSLPVIDGSSKAGNKDETPVDIEGQIAASEGDGEEQKGSIFLAFHKGVTRRIENVIPGKSIMYPMPFTDEYIQNLEYTPTRTNNDGATLRLEKLDGLVYKSNYEIDRRKGIVITSYDQNVYDTKCVFVIRNKRYVCKESEYIITNDGRKKAWKGTFYPIKLSDTETYQRWVLADGKWRDGGVWLDNGRWLDK